MSGLLLAALWDLLWDLLYVCLVVVVFARLTVVIKAMLDRYARDRKGN